FETVKTPTVGFIGRYDVFVFINLKNSVVLVVQSPLQFPPRVPKYIPTNLKTQCAFQCDKIGSSVRLIQRIQPDTDHPRPLVGSFFWLTGKLLGPGHVKS